MSNAAKDISSGLSSMGGGLKIPRTGFRGKKEKPAVIRGGKKTTTKEVESAPEEKETEAKTQKTEEKRNNTETSTPEKPDYDRITFEITADQRAILTSIASDLHFRSDKNRRQGKINRDMIMRSVLAETVKTISWENGVGELHTEDDIRKFVRSQLKSSK